MKKTILLLTTILICLSFVACGGKWHTLYSDSEMEIEVKLNSIQRHGNVVSFEERTTYSKGLPIATTDNERRRRTAKYRIISRDVDCYNFLTRS
jgi:hypothetical protein